MSVTNVSIANRALTLLSASRITALTQASEEARKVNAIFEDTRDALLSEHNWNFAVKERAVSLLSTAPILDDWSFCYQIPSDCIRVIRMSNDESFTIKGTAIYSNSDDARIEYVSRETDPTKFSRGFIKAFASRLAADLAFGITQNATLATNMDATAQRDLKEAKWSDAQEGNSVTIQEGTFFTARQR